MSSTLYQCLVFGAPTAQQVSVLTRTISKAMADFGLKSNEHFSISEGYGPGFVETVPTVAVFFGGAGAALPEHQNLMRLSIPIVPLVSDLEKVCDELPECLRPLNALTLVREDVDLVRPSGQALQCLGLLPTQRRVFVSYRRTESRDVAVQLFEALSARQFDVFLDTHSVAAATDFQSVLWHRLCDCDVVVMLDTPGFFDSRWAKLEWGRATGSHAFAIQCTGHSACPISRRFCGWQAHRGNGRHGRPAS